MASGSSQLSSLLLTAQSTAAHQEEDMFQMSREEKEKLLNQKMENIRKRNEELRKRHEEIEADKQNADKFSSTVTMEEVKPYVMKAPRVRPDRAERQREMNDPPPPRPADIMPARQRLSENDGPPPDPSYRFLSDPDRDGSENTRENKREFRGRGGRGRGRGKGGGRESHEDGDENTKQEGEVEHSENSSSGGFGGRGRGRGRGRGGGYDNFNGERGFGRGRGRGRGRGNDRLRHDFENYAENGTDSIQGGGDNAGASEGRGGSRGRFASRDIRYYNDEEGDSGAMRGGSGRGFGNSGQRHAYDDGDGPGRGRGRGRGNFDHRGRGRGRGRGQQREYERWKAEREAIDEARLSRSRTHGGGWRREWDNDKLDQGNIEETEPVYDPRYPRSKGEGFKLADYLTTSEGDDKGNSPKEGSGDHRPTRGRGSRGKFRGQGRFIDPELNAQKHEEEIMAELDPDAVFGQRKIEGRGDSFTISVSNTTHSSAGKFVRVGSGRMGQNKRSPPQHDHGVDESGEGERQHHRGRGRGGRHPRGRGRGQGRGYFNNKENSPYKWVRPSDTTAQVSSPDGGSQNSKELEGPSSAVAPIAGESAEDSQTVEKNENVGTASLTNETESQQEGDSKPMQEEMPVGAEDVIEGDELEDYEDEEIYEEAAEEYYDEDYQEAEGEEEKIEESSCDDGAEASVEDGNAHVDAQSVVSDEKDKENKPDEDEKKEDEMIGDKGEKSGLEENDGTLNKDSNEFIKEILENEKAKEEIEEKEEKQNPTPQSEKSEAAPEDVVTSIEKTEDEEKKEGNIVDKEGEHKEDNTEDSHLKEKEKSDDVVPEESQPAKERPSKLEVSNTGDGTSMSCMSENDTNAKEEVTPNEEEKKTETITKLTPSPTKTTEGDKKPESRLTPASSPAKTEELVPNIEWK